MSKKYLVITGGSRGIGLATAKLFLEQEFQVINLSRNLCPLPDVVNIQIDLAAKGFEENLKQELLPKLEYSERVILVHNAARLDKDNVENIQANNLRDILEINMVAPTILNQIVMPKMSKGSAIIYVGSTLSEKAVPGAFSYVTSKHAAVGLMRATCQDLIDRGIHTACVCPGFTDTPMLRNHLNHDETIIEQIKTMNAQNRLIEASEIAQTIYFAATNPVINGAILHANMGQKER
ncbi:MAG: SDR family oxidoreductase [Okeania sp. SIO2G4]|uniref:SDR family oxidoreductase n=1 Tax=unclassified Okeania TaxID=2634635 RepID=UPI0013B9AA49|nr:MULTISPECIES: SDR family oxidoreductase [unclassified Okeania]NEP45258.1 SDR family oxidoreductase [Okeania sp. SIO2H7]NEP74012.1 SDR family oxidoreductase [Okeania sp. SIO2G5]NEP94831.1 SDR family oxidoreductase [Okeania sp. SIO2F5]NEQ93792.1 SDR family oxidoreductase [Okeania sp. SIO2G4]